MSTAATSPAPRVVTQRLIGIDAARGVALLAMMANHLFPSYVEDAGSFTWVYLLTDGRASALFAVVAGVSLALADGGADGPRIGRSRMLARTAVRAVLVGLLGLLLAALGTRILVILVYYALMFVLVAPAIRLPRAVLAGLAGLWVVAAPVVSHVVRAAFDLEPVIASPSFGAVLTDPGGSLVALLLTGTYPAFTWLAYLLAGAALGRSRLASRRLLGLLVAVGLVVALAVPALAAWLLAAAADTSRGAADVMAYDGRFFGTTPTDTWWWLARPDGHSGTPVDLMATIGSAVVVVAVMMLVTQGQGSRWWWWLIATGSMTLTLYSLHLLMYALGVGVGFSGTGRWLIQSVVVVAVAVLWRARSRRGPLESAVGRTVDTLAGSAAA